MSYSTWLAKTKNNGLSFVGGTLLGAICVITALTVLYGWLANKPIVLTLVHHATPMNPMTASAFLGLGISYILIATKSFHPSYVRYFTRVVSGLTIVLGLSMVAYYLWHIDLKLDRLLFTSRLGINRMAASTAVCFVAIGLSTFLLTYSGGAKKWGRILVIPPVFISVYTLVLYAYGVQPVYGHALTNPMALNTAIVFFAASMALLVLRARSFKLYLKPSLIVVYACAIGLVVLLSVINHRSFVQLGQYNQMSQTLYIDKNDISDLRQALTDAETGQRGYLLTGDTDYLAPYTSATRQVLTKLSKVVQIPEPYIKPSEEAVLTRSVIQKGAELSQTIQLRQNNQAKEAQALVLTGQGKQYMDSVRVILDATDVRIDTALHDDVKQSDAQNRNSLLLLAASTAVIVCLLSAILYLSQEYFKRHYEQDTEETDPSDASY